jgi:HK97 gp10 family phage protein
MSVSIDINKLDSAISDILKEYGDVVFTATDEALAAGEKVLIKNLKAASPKDKGDYKKAWRGTGKKYKLRRFVGNTTTVISKGKATPLTNILEYSTTKGKPFVKKTYESNVNEIARAIVNEIKKGV